MQITSVNKKYFKNFIKDFYRKNTDFVPISYRRLKNIFSSYDTSLNTDPYFEIKIIPFKSGDFINLTTKAYDGEYLYLPGLENDIVGLEYGNDSIILGFDQTGSLYYYDYLLPLGTQINLDGKRFTVKGLGGALLSVTDIPPGPTYDVVESSTAVNEGDVVTFTINTSNVADGTVLYYTISGTVSSSDFTDGLLSGSITINNNTATFTKTLANDITPIGTEGSESFAVSIRLNSLTGTIVTSSSAVNVADTSVLSYSISQSSTSLNEGDSVTFTVTTQGVPNGTTLYYTTTGTVSSNDFTDGLLSGSFTINNNSAVLSKTLSNDLTVVGSENQETFQIQIRTGSITGSIVATSSTITVEDTSISSYTLTQSATQIDEGESVNFTLTTVGIPNETTLYYTSSNITDVTPPSGSFVVNDNTSSFSVTALQDAIIESDESFFVNVRTSSVTGDIVAISSEITIKNKTSVSVGVSTTIIFEGESVTFTVTPTGIPNGTVLNYSHSGDALPQSGSFTIINGSGAFTLTAIEDALVESIETFTVDIKNSLGNTLATSPSISITNTTSITLTPSAISITEGESITFNVSTVGIPNLTTLYYTASNNAANSLDILPINGNFVINNNSGEFSIGSLQDFTSESLEFLEVQVRASSLTGPVIATSPVISIQDSPFTLDIIPEKTVIPESTLGNNSSLKFDIITTNVGSGTTFTAVLNTSLSTANSSDLNNFFSTVITINNNAASFTVPISRDARTEGSETFVIDVYNKNGVVVAQSPVIAISDDSYIGSRKIGRTFGPIAVKRDGGNKGNISDWYSLCNLDNIPNGSKVVVFIDSSGSMNMNTVKSSYELLVQKLNERKIKVILIENPNENWISAFDSSF
jgi:hypothetical protein